MTRGQMVLVEKKNGNIIALDTVEFNGDMYPNGIGNDAINLLNTSYSETSFTKKVAEFNKEHYGYPEDLIYEVSLDSVTLDSVTHPIIDFTDYYNAPIGFSDYIYIKNITDDDIFIKSKSGDVYLLEKNTVCGFSFGEYCGEPEDISTDGIRLSNGLTLFYDEYDEAAEDEEKVYMVHAILKVPISNADENTLYSDLEDEVSNALFDSNISICEIEHIQEY